MGLETTCWDAADYLGTDAALIAYLEAAFEDGDAALVAAALNDVARARGLANDVLAEDVSLAAVIERMKALGLELTARAAA